MKAVNLVLRFALELWAFGALAYAGYQVPGALWLKITMAVLLPLAGAGVWARWVAPKASHPIPDPVRLIPEWFVFGGAAIALGVTGHPIQGAVLAVLAAANRLVLHLLRTGTGGERISGVDEAPRT